MVEAVSYTEFTANAEYFSIYNIWARFIVKEGNGRLKLIIEKCNLLYTLVNTDEAVSYTGAHKNIIARLLAMQTVC